MKKKWIIIWVLVFLVICSFVLRIIGHNHEEKKQVVFLNNFINISDKLEEYEKSFEKLHPDIDIKIESVGDQYENISIVRLNANKAGDVMVIPSYMNLSDYPDYYEPLYSVSEALNKYRFSDIKAIDDKVYSIPLSMTVSGGILYDMKILNDAGITKIPRSLDDLKEALRAVKTRTNAVPLYSNARGEEQLISWNGLIYSLEGSNDYMTSMVNENNIFSSDSRYYEVYKFLYECVSENLIESPFTSSKWDGGLELIKKGNLASAVVNFHMYEEAKQYALNSDSIEYFPLKSAGGDYYLYGEPSYGIGINKESKNKEEAKMWMEYLLDETDFLNYAGDAGMLVKNDKPEYEKMAQTNGLNIIYPDRVTEENIGKFEKIDNEACLGIYGGSFAFNLINSAAEGKNNYDELCIDWNNRWNSASKEINKK